MNPSSPNPAAIHLEPAAGEHTGSPRDAAPAPLPDTNAPDRPALKPGGLSEAEQLLEQQRLQRNGD